MYHIYHFQLFAAMARSALILALIGLVAVSATPLRVSQLFSEELQVHMTFLYVGVTRDHQC